TWVAAGAMTVPEHDRYFTYGETVGKPGSAIPDAGLRWLYTPPPVHLPSWPATAAPADAPYTAVSGWWADDDYACVDGRFVENDKRSSFLDLLDLPRRVEARLELALPLDEESDPTGDLVRLRSHGWKIRHVREVSA